MSTFKVGDRVKISRFPGRWSSALSNKYPGELSYPCELTINQIKDLGDNIAMEAGGYGFSLTELEEESVIELINNKKTIMPNIKEKFTLAFTSEPEKTFRKAGITNGDNFLTDDGEKIFLTWLLKKYGADFKKEVVDDLVADEK